MKNSASAIAALALVAFGATASWAQEPGILTVGDAVVTSFSGVIDPESDAPPGSSDQKIDETVIDVQGVSARILPLGLPAYLWDGRVWTQPSTRDFTASEVGQVFGVTMDDAEQPNIYLAATSVYGLNIVAPDSDGDGRAERLKKGRIDAQWMPGQWGIADSNDPAGAVGGPGSIWKVDGKTGEVSLFANVTFEGAANSGAGLGNVHYDPTHKQIFVSDLSTGMIHRYNLQGEEQDVYDPGLAGLEMGGEKGEAYDPAGALDIASKDFDSDDHETWGYVAEQRRVWALSTFDGRLYYAMVGRNQIWSVGIDKDSGALLKDARWELDYPKKPKELPITDMVFSSQGVMVLAQRGETTSPYDYSNLAEPGRTRIYRYVREEPNKPDTPSIWSDDIGEYSIGFDPDYRAGAGGIALGHGYTTEGILNDKICEGSLWVSGDNLRRNEELAEQLKAGGPLIVDGVQGMPTGPVRQYDEGDNNTPPWTSYILDVNTENTDAELPTEKPLPWSDDLAQGWMGDIHVLRGCGNKPKAEEAVAEGDTQKGWDETWPYTYELASSTETVTTTGRGCIIGVNCPPPKRPNACARTEGEFVCDATTGKWTYGFGISHGAKFKANTVKFSGISPGHSLDQGLVTGYGDPATYSLSGGWSGQVMSADLCLFDSAAEKTGKPYACCKLSIDVKAPSKACVKKAP